MSEEIRLPEISENVENGDVVKVLVAVGDVVAVDQPLIELETEKAVFEVPSTTAGTVTEILVKEGETVKVGQALIRIDASATADGAAAGRDSAAVDDRAAASADAPQPGTDDVEKPAAVDTGAQAPAAPARDEADELHDAAVAVAEETTADPSGQPAPASPTVRRLARELGIDIHHVKGAGPGGRISAEDVQAHAKRIITGAQGGAPAGTGAGSASAIRLPDFTRWGEIERAPMSKVRAITATNMAAAWNSVPHVTQYDKADITDTEAARKQFGKKAEAAGGKLTMTAILVKVIAAALKVFPDFNASVDVANQEIIYKKYINIGIAVDTDRGLLVPVIKDAGNKNIIELSVELNAIAEKAREKKIMPDALEGGSFTISNLGGIGGTYFSPIVYAPEVAILGVSRAVKEPVFKDGEFVPRFMLPLSLSYDHRIIDGANAARFIRWVSEALEKPFLIALEG